MSAFTSEIGTNRTSGDVRSSVAIGGKADMAWTAPWSAIDPKPSSRERGHGECCCAVSTKSDRMTPTSVQLSSATPTGEGEDAAA
jgi:hypothetical protein